MKGRSGLGVDDIRRIEESGERVVLIHNHPNSTKPSWTDVETVAARGWVDRNIIVCHDGTVYEVTCQNPDVLKAYEFTYSKIKAGSKGILSDKQMRNETYELILKANEGARWFRIKKVMPK